MKHKRFFNNVTLITLITHLFDEYSFFFVDKKTYRDLSSRFWLPSYQDSVFETKLYSLVL